MDRPKGFIHWTPERGRYSSFTATVPGHLSIGRVEITGVGITMAIFGLVVPLFLLQIILSVVSGGTIWWPLLGVAGIAGLVLLTFIGVGIAAFFRTLAGHVTIKKPGE